MRINRSAETKPRRGANISRDYRTAGRRHDREAGDSLGKRSNAQMGGEMDHPSFLGARNWIATFTARRTAGLSRAQPAFWQSVLDASALIWLLVRLSTGSGSASAGRRCRSESQRVSPERSWCRSSLSRSASARFAGLLAVSAHAYRGEQAGTNAMHYWRLHSS